MTLLSNSPVARNSDPITSHLAADQIKNLRAAQQQRVLAIVRSRPGKTSAEYAELLGTDRFMPARRLPEMAPKYLTRGSVKRCTITGKLCLTWWPASI